MDTKQLTETDIRTKFITPALVGTSSAKWNVMTQVREEGFFTKGRVIVRGKAVRRGEAKKADYILYFKPGVPIAVIEAKDNNHSVGAGILFLVDRNILADQTKTNDFKPFGPTPDPNSSALDDLGRRSRISGPRLPGVRPPTSGLIQDSR
jgi:type I site-specific restriction endonuclease